MSDQTAATLSIKVHHREIDAIHEQLAELVKKLATAPDGNFTSLFTTLIEHTESHFSREEQMMQECGFPHSAEHLAEHRQILQEMRLFQRRITPVRMALVRAYVKQRLPERLDLHISRMDSLLAAYLQKGEGDS